MCFTKYYKQFNVVFYLRLNTDNFFHRYAAFILVVQFTSTILSPRCGYF